jgi:hypothetical protein
MLLLWAFSLKNSSIIWKSINHNAGGSTAVFGLTMEMEMLREL